MTMAGQPREDVGVAIGSLSTALTKYRQDDMVQGNDVR
jgi:hypothetical protein